MKLFDDGDIQLLRGEQHFDFAAPERCRNRRVKKRLTERTLRESKRIG